MHLTHTSPVDNDQPASSSASAAAAAASAGGGGGGGNGVVSDACLCQWMVDRMADVGEQGGATLPCTLCQQIYHEGCVQYYGERRLFVCHMCRFRQMDPGRQLVGRPMWLCALGGGKDRRDHLIDMERLLDGRLWWERQAIVVRCLSAHDSSPRQTWPEELDVTVNSELAIRFKRQQAEREEPRDVTRYFLTHTVSNVTVEYRNPPSDIRILGFFVTSHDPWADTNSPTSQRQSLRDFYDNGPAPAQPPAPPAAAAAAAAAPSSKVLTGRKATGGKAPRKQVATLRSAPAAAASAAAGASPPPAAAAAAPSSKAWTGRLMPRGQLATLPSGWCGRMQNLGGPFPSGVAFLSGVPSRPQPARDTEEESGGPSRGRSSSVPRWVSAAPTSPSAAPNRSASAPPSPANRETSAASAPAAAASAAAGAPPPPAAAAAAAAGGGGGPIRWHSRTWRMDLSDVADGMDMDDDRNGRDDDDSDSDEDMRPMKERLAGRLPKDGLGFFRSRRAPNIPAEPESPGDPTKCCLCKVGEPAVCLQPCGHLLCGRCFASRPLETLGGLERAEEAFEADLDNVLDSRDNELIRSSSCSHVHRCPRCNWSVNCITEADGSTPVDGWRFLGKSLKDVLRQREAMGDSLRMDLEALLTRGDLNDEGVREQIKAMIYPRPAVAKMIMSRGIVKENDMRQFFPDRMASVIRFLLFKGDWSLVNQLVLHGLIPQPELITVLRDACQLILKVTMAGRAEYLALVDTLIPLANINLTDDDSSPLSILANREGPCTQAERALIAECVQKLIDGGARVGRFSLRQTLPMPLVRQLIKVPNSDLTDIHPNGDTILHTVINRMSLQDFTRPVVKPDGSYNPAVDAILTILRIRRQPDGSLLLLKEGRHYPDAPRVPDRVASMANLEGHLPLHRLIKKARECGGSTTCSAAFDLVLEALFKRGGAPWGFTRNRADPANVHFVDPPVFIHWNEIVLGDGDWMHRWFHDKPLLRKLFANGMDTNIRDTKGNTLLHRSIRQGSAGREDVVGFLLSQGVDPSARNHAGETALGMLYNLIATRPLAFEPAHLLSVLVSHGADTHDIRRHDGRPQSLLSLYRPQGIPTAVRRGGPGSTPPPTISVSAEQYRAVSDAVASGDRNQLVGVLVNMCLMKTFWPVNSHIPRTPLWREALFGSPGRLMSYMRMGALIDPIPPDLRSRPATATVIRTYHSYLQGSKKRVRYALEGWTAAMSELTNDVPRDSPLGHFLTERLPESLMAQFYSYMLPPTFAALPSHLFPGNTPFHNACRGILTSHMHTMATECAKGPGGLGEPGIELLIMACVILLEPEILKEGLRVGIYEMIPPATPDPQQQQQQQPSSSSSSSSSSGAAPLQSDAFMALSDANAALSTLEASVEAIMTALRQAKEQAAVDGAANGGGGGGGGEAASSLNAGPPQQSNNNAATAAAAASEPASSAGVGVRSGSAGGVDESARPARRQRL
ncbi:unnamed protein product [Vitrella brassicaformis CCMP3155]|uniref:Uncharacterized protein n=3 Tax=Vitrella brassicaformis TaxID=1169539 RepID=A0A0G4FNL9_VITBC|nr:unnamed protein product [Vitrella brassicaformis CCMP3155]|eukprot:CEM15237.1 unnamed protein product [Vitrella brassicaformis CCMP3155]